MITIGAIAALSMLTLLSGRQARREAVLMGELEHRVKNTLTVVAAVIERAHDNTQSIDEFVESLRGRCLSRSEGSIRWQRNRDLELIADLHSVFKFLDFPQAPPLDETRPC